MTSPIVVCGAGIAGMATALALAQRKQAVTLLAPHATIPAAQAQAIDARVYAISPASRAFLQRLHVWDALPDTRYTRVEGMDVYGDKFGRVALDAWQAAQADMAWIVESREIERVLAQALRLAGVTWIDDRCAGLGDRGVTTEKGAAIAADLIVGADGAQSPVRRFARMTHRSRSYGDTGVIVHLDAGVAHQGRACQWFLSDSVLGLLPLPDTARGSQVSMVWSMATPRAQALLALGPEAQRDAIAGQLAAVTRNRLGTLVPNGPLHGFPLFVEHGEMIAPGVALVGDAAHRVHPLAGQGLNLGLGDVEALAEIVAARSPMQSAGDLQVLRRYRRARAEPVAAMRLATDGLYQLFATSLPPVVWLRNAGMRAVNAMPAIKRRLIDSASGK